MEQYFSILDFGAVPDTLCTQAIQRAFDAASASHGTVLIPPGTFITGTLDMGKASLYLQKGAVLLGSPHMEDYRHNGYAHNEMRQTISLLYAMDADGIRVSGEGTIDCNGSHFFDFDRRNPAWNSPPLTDEQLQECPVCFAARPTQPLFFLNCRNVDFRDITIRNAPCWTLSFHNCEDIRITDLTIRNDPVIPNNDGLHFCGCRRCIIRGCNIVAGDDCLALSGITDWDIPCEDFVISDCVFTSTSKAIVLGYMHSIVRNISISNCILRDSQRGLCIMTSTTGLVENITVSNLRVDTRVRAGSWWGNGEPVCIYALFHDNPYYLRPMPQRNWPVNIRNVRLTGLSCAAENLIGIVGTGENVRDITIDGLSFYRKPSANAYLKGINAVDTAPSEVTARAPAQTPEYWLCAQGCRDVTIRGLSVGDLKAHGENCQNLRIE